jgi:hypothetical protein
MINRELHMDNVCAAYTAWDIRFNIITKDFSGLFGALRLALLPTIIFHSTHLLVKPMVIPVTYEWYHQCYCKLIIRSAL